MKFDLNSRLFQNERTAKALGLGGFNFSKRIASKYGIFRKKGRLPSLIFLRLSGVRSMNKESSTVHRISISNFLKLQFSFYFGFIRQLIKKPDNYHLQKLYNSMNTRKETFLPHTNERFLSHTNERFLLHTNARFLPNTIQRFLPNTNKRSIETMKISGENFRIKVPLISASYMNAHGFFRRALRGSDFRGDIEYRSQDGRSTELINDGQQRSDLQYFKKSANNVRDLISPQEEIPSGSASTIINVKPPKGTNAFEKEITGSNEYQEHIQEGPVKSGKDFLTTRSYSIIQPIRMVTYTVNVTMSHSQRIPDTWNFDSGSSQIGYPLVSGKQPYERRSFPAGIMNSLSVGKDALPAKPYYPLHVQNGVVTDISYENISPEKGAGNNFIFTRRHLIARSANIALIYSNPEINSYLNKMLNVENIVSKNRAIQTQVPKSDSNKIRETSEPALAGVSGHPDDKSVLPQRMNEPEISYRNIPEEDGRTGKNLVGPRLISMPFKMISNLGNTVNLGYFQRFFNSMNMVSKSDRSIQDMKEKYTGSFRQNGTITNTYYENGITEYGIAGRKNRIISYRGGNILKSTDDHFSEMVFALEDNDQKYGTLNQGMKTLIGASTGDIARNFSSELILKKPAIQNTQINSENKATVEKTASQNINETFIRGSFKEKPPHEINRIADTVYKIIEKRIMIEKDRRGLF